MRKVDSVFLGWVSEDGDWREGRHCRLCFYEGGDARGSLTKDKVDSVP